MTPERINLSVREAARLLGLGRSTVFTLLKSGELRSIKVAGRRLIPVAAVREFQDRRESEQSAA